jgi:hypothetical protein
MVSKRRRAILIVSDQGDLICDHRTVRTPTGLKMGRLKKTAKLTARAEQKQICERPVYPLGHALQLGKVIGKASAVQIYECSVLRLTLRGALIGQDSFHRGTIGFKGLVDLCGEPFTNRPTNFEMRPGYLNCV